MTRSIVWRLLRRNISIGQLAGYALANLVGLAIVVTAIQFYRDVTAAWQTEDSFISRDYLIISKRVEGINLNGASSEFTPGEIASIEEQPWVRKVGRFKAAEFSVTASIDMMGRGMSTALFLEAIPDEFFDVKPRGWEWSAVPRSDGQLQEVPIVISKDYLTLYNFGFAASRGYPQLSEATIGQIPLNVSISGNGRQLNVIGRIVGFSSRLNTFAVPETFLQWANENLSDNSAANPSRLIIEVNTPGDPAINKYLTSHGYESAGDKADNGRAAYFLSVVTGVVIAVGIVISLLAFFILLLSIHLLLQKNRDKLRSLMMLGYRPAAVARYYYIIVATINGCVLIGAIVAMLIGRSLWAAPLSSIGLSGSSPWVAILIGLAIILLITLGNFRAIASNVGRTFPRPRR